MSRTLAKVWQQLSSQRCPPRPRIVGLPGQLATFARVVETISIALILVALVAALQGEVTRAGGDVQTASYSAVAIADASAPPYEVIVPLILRSYPLVTGSAWSTTVVVQNASGDSATLTLDYRDSTGDVVFSLRDTLPPGGQRSYDQGILASLGESFVGTLVIISTQPLTAVTYVQDPTWDGDGLVSFTPRGRGATVLYAQPVYNDVFGTTSQLVVANRGDSATSVSIEFVSPTGDPLATHSDVVASHGSAIYDPGSIADLPSGLDGNSMAVIHSDQSLEAAVIHLNPGSAIASGASLADTPGLPVFLPSLTRTYSENSATSGYRLWNLGTNVATVTASFYDTDGRGLVADVLSVAPGTQSYAYLGADPSLPEGFIGSAVVTSNEPLVAEVGTVLSAPGASMAYLGVSSTASTLYAPALRRSAVAYTALTVQNASDQTALVTLSYYDQDGTLVARQQAETLPAYTSHVYDQSQMSALGEEFSGSAVVGADQPLAAVVQEYRPVEDSGLTPTPTVSPTPTSTPTTEPADQFVFLPLVAKTWPPIPARPVLHDISIDCNDNDYLVAWDVAEQAASYSLQEDDDFTFPNPTTVYEGSSTAYYMSDKAEGIFYYRVRASNEWGDGPWSEVKSVTVGPPTTLWIIYNDTGDDLTIDIHGVGRRIFPAGEHTWCVPSGEHTVTARGQCGSRTLTILFEPYSAIAHRFPCDST